MDTILYGRLIFIKQNQKYNNWEVFDKVGKKVGYFSVNVVGKRKNKEGMFGMSVVKGTNANMDVNVSASYNNNNNINNINNNNNNNINSISTPTPTTTNTTSPQHKHSRIRNTNHSLQITDLLSQSQPQILIINSIIANINNLKSKHSQFFFAKLQIQNNIDLGKIIKTGNVKSKTGELIFVDKYQIDIGQREYINIDIDDKIKVKKQYNKQQIGLLQQQQNKQENIQQKFLRIEIYSTATDRQDQKVAYALIKIPSIDIQTQNNNINNINNTQKNTRKIDRKLKFFNNQNQQIGQGFIDAKLVKKNDLNYQKMIKNMLSKKRMINNRKQLKTKGQQKWQIKQVNNFDSSTKDLSGSKISYSRLKDKNNNSRVKNGITLKPTHNHRKSLDLQYFNSIGSSRLTKNKNISIVNTNSSIKIPKQKRFFTSRDPPNNKCSYLPQQTFEFKQKHGGIYKYYRGASIGYGDKSNFTSGKKQMPGVGKYQLPSIWDRY